MLQPATQSKTGFSSTLPDGAVSGRQLLHVEAIIHGEPSCYSTPTGPQISISCARRNQVVSPDMDEIKQLAMPSSLNPSSWKKKREKRLAASRRVRRNLGLPITPSTAMRRVLLNKTLTSSVERDMVSTPERVRPTKRHKLEKMPPSLPQSQFGFVGQDTSFQLFKDRIPTAVPSTYEQQQSVAVGDTFSQELRRVALGLRTQRPALSQSDSGLRLKDLSHSEKHLKKKQSATETATKQTSRNNSSAKLSATKTATKQTSGSNSSAKLSATKTATKQTSRNNSSAKLSATKTATKQTSGSNSSAKLSATKTATKQTSGSNSSAKLSATKTATKQTSRNNSSAKLSATKTATKQTSRNNSSAKLSATKTATKQTSGSNSRVATSFKEDKKNSTVQISSSVAPALVCFRRRHQGNLRAPISVDVNHYLLNDNSIQNSKNGSIYRHIDI